MYRISDIELNKSKANLEKEIFELQEEAKKQGAIVGDGLRASEILKTIHAELARKEYTLLVTGNRDKWATK